MTELPATSRSVIIHHLPRLGVLLLVCIVMYWSLLGNSSFSQSEGHRVVPGWTMLNTGDFGRIEMFGTTYVRKPPGMPWAIAAGSAILGQNEFGARAASALSITLMSFSAYAFTAYWFGRGRPAREAAKLGLIAGLAQALMPQMWSPGRTAEIEALNCCMTQLGALGLIHLYLHLRAQYKAEGRSPSVFVRNSRGLRWAVILVTALGWTGAALAKGPASLPVLLGTLIAIAAVPAVFRGTSVPPVQARARGVLHWSLWLPLMCAGVAIALFAQWLLRANADPHAVREDVSGFLWSFDHLVGVLTLIPVAWASALPISLAWLFPWGKHARQEQTAAAIEHTPFADARDLARLLGIAWLASLAIFAVAGVHNPRYAMPAACFFAPMTAYVALGIEHGFFVQRRQIARALTLGSWCVWGVLLMGLGGAWWVFAAPTFNSHHNGTNIANVIAADGPRAQPLVLWSDDLIEARPDLLLYIQRAAADLPEPIALNIQWQKWAMLDGRLPPPGSYMLLRHDDRSGEDERYAGRTELVLVHDIIMRSTPYSGRLYRVVEPQPAAPDSSRTDP